jgi:hypothetical protein
MNYRFVFFSFLFLFVVSGFVSAECVVGEISGGEYCDVDGETTITLKLNGADCINGFECEGGSCVEDICASRFGYLEEEEQASILDTLASICDTPGEDLCDGTSWVAVCNSENNWEEQNVYVVGHCGFVVNTGSSGGGYSSSSGGDEIFCGDEICDLNESCSSCPQDCGTCFLAQSGSGISAESSECGDGICDIDESSNNCIQDCPLEVLDDDGIGWGWIVLIAILVVAILIIVSVLLYKKFGKKDDLEVQGVDANNKLNTQMPPVTPAVAPAVMPASNTIEKTNLVLNDKSLPLLPKSQNVSPVDKPSLRDRIFNRNKDFNKA